MNKDLSNKELTNAELTNKDSLNKEELISREDNILQQIPTYCVNLITSTERREKMIQRFEKTGFKNYTFVDAIPKGSELLKKYYDNIECWYSDKELWLRDISCFASHVLAVRKFVESGANLGLICEDDILFRNNFFQLLEKYISVIGDNFNLLSLCYMISGAVDQTPMFQKDSGIWKIDTLYTWGAQCYLLQRDYATRILKLYDRHFSEIRYDYDNKIHKITSEILLRRSNGYMVATPLVIEDCISSDRATKDIPYHVKHYVHWGFKNYNLCDPDCKSPLRNLTQKDGWLNYPFCKK